ncbi:FXYD domain-containing ion transport regulator 5 [Perognathus longimembris pacificus]|uniref:FXYD domain-containing ion transport regulator 5 n=1 Tax=Perognathus longimembris pacificus TaxID=214514 RepID=UPI002018BFC0|nr:FXYD domain-containing ion transport regulator 5 [Perognathus longimembris pacificus]
MGPSGGLYVFILVGLAVPSREPRVALPKSLARICPTENAFPCTSSRDPTPTTENTYIPSHVTSEEREADTASPDFPSRPHTWTQLADEITRSQTELQTGDAEPEAETGAVTETPAPTGTGTGSPPATEPARPGSTERGTPTLPEEQSAGKHFWVLPQTPKPPGVDEADPFTYDEGTLRRRGLLVAAVLFVTGIIILTSGKCRQLSRLCRRRAYSVVHTGRPEQEDAGAGSQTCS